MRPRGSVIWLQLGDRRKSLERRIAVFSLQGNKPDKEVPFHKIRLELQRLPAKLTGLGDLTLSQSLESAPQEITKLATLNIAR